MRKMLLITMSFLMLFNLSEAMSKSLHPQMTKMLGLNKYISQTKAQQSQMTSLGKSSISHQGLTSAGQFSGGIAGEITGISADWTGEVNIYAYPAMDSGWGGADMTKGYTVISGNGHYQIDGLSDGAYTVTVLADGYQQLYYNQVDDLPKSTYVHVHGGAITDNINFTMEKFVPGTGSITGTVKQEGNEKSISNAVISIISLDHPWLYVYTISDDQGVYHLTGLKSGTYYVSVWAEGYLGEFYDNAKTWDEATALVVTESNEITGVDFLLNPCGSISGYVRDKDGNPVTEASITAYTIFPDSGIIIDPGSGGKSGFGATSPDADGRYVINDLGTGQYYVMVETWNEWTHQLIYYPNAATEAEAELVPVVEGQQTQGIDFQITIEKPHGVIFGRVVDANGNPLPDVYVQVQSNYYDPYYKPFWAEVVTDKDGNYRIEGLINGSYLVSAYANAGWQFVQRWWPDAESPENATPVIINDDIVPISIDFTLPVKIGTCSISGYVLSDENQPLIGASIVLNPSQPVNQGGTQTNAVWAYANSDSTGFYLIEHLPEGSYIAQASYWSSDNFGQEYFDNVELAENATPIVLAENEKRDDINFSVDVRPMYGSIYGTVVDSRTGLPVSRAYVEITPTVWYRDMYMRPFWCWNYSAITDDAGRYTFDGLFEGEYLISVYANGAFEYYQDAANSSSATLIKVVGGIKSQIDFGLTPRNDGTGSISGSVVSEWENTPFDIAVVTARPVLAGDSSQTSDFFYSAVTQKEGTFTLNGLADGDYYVMSFTQGGITEYYDNVFDPSLATLVHVKEGQPVTGIDFQLSPAWYLDYAKFNEGSPSNAAVAGHVSDGKNTPIEGATIIVLTASNSAIASVRTGVTGNYEIYGLPPGNYVLQATSIGYASNFNGTSTNFSEAAPVYVGSGSVEINFILSPQSMSVKPDGKDKMPKELLLLGNYPNPFNPQTQIKFALPKDMTLTVDIYNVKGEHIVQLYNGRLSAGEHSIVWNGLNQEGQNVSSGLYLYRLASTAAVKTGKMLLVR
jgi:protocatechuate 3,4-dioxygenase beta subunit